LTTPAAAATRRAIAVPTAVAVGLGAMLALQSYVNGHLGRSLGSAEVAAAINNAVGLVALAAAAAAIGAIGRALRSLHRLRVWHVLGGLGGAMYVVAGAVGAPEVGVALLSVALVCGQTAGSLVADGAGLSPAGRQEVTTGRIAGVCLTVAAVAASALGARANLHVGIIAFTVAAGVATALHQAANGHLARDTGEPLVAGTVNFAVGSSRCSSSRRWRADSRRRTAGRRHRSSTSAACSARRSPPRWR
jgi:bacterial/archaeal transporter family-2 protein